MSTEEDQFTWGWIWYLILIGSALMLIKSGT
jgi:hypothetical protein